MRFLKLINAPTEEPLTLDEAKDHMNVVTDDQNALIWNQIRAARLYVERRVGRALITQVWEQTLDAFPPNDGFAAGVIELSLPPLQSVVSVIYRDNNGTPTTINSANYVVDSNSEPGRLAMKWGLFWPYSMLQPLNAVTVRFVCGYADAASVPQTLKQAMLMLVAHWYENREATAGGLSHFATNSAIEYAVEALLGLYYVPAVA